jgi:hypothetical protein
MSGDAPSPLNRDIASATYISALNDIRAVVAAGGSVQYQVVVAQSGYATYINPFASAPGSGGSGYGSGHVQLQISASYSNGAPYGEVLAMGVAAASGNTYANQLSSGGVGTAFDPN